MYYNEMSLEDLKNELTKLKKEYENFKSENLSIDMSRGKPCKEQLDLSMGILSVLNKNSDLICEDGTDCRNYGVLGGIEEARELLSSFMENDIKNILIYGNSSLNVMYMTVIQAYVFGIMGNTPWSKLPKVKFLCPVPGYDRHFAICEEFNIEMINIKMTAEGPDMDTIEKLVENDELIKGIWCVPKYSNPDGITYSDDTVKRFARLKPKAKDFRIFWDNAYTVHHLYDDRQDYILEILEECKRVGNEDIVYKFASTSKICFPGSGLAALSASEANIADIKKHLKIQTIGYDKVNELRHFRFFKNIQGIKNHMKKHADILRPKFEMVENILDKNLSEYKIAHWTSPRGGYFISYYTLEGLATKVIKYCLALGVKLTPAGSTYPYHKDPYDNNIRIAPSYPSLDELEKAMYILALTTKIATIEKYIKEKK